MDTMMATSQDPKRQHVGMTMKQMVAKNMPAPTGAGINYTITTTLSPAESKRNYNIQALLNRKNFKGYDITRKVLPHDNKNSELARELETRRQLAQPWGSTFMYTPTDKQRLNNVSQQAYMKQRRLVPDNTYGGFYAFMHALSAAFGTLNGG